MKSDSGEIEREDQAAWAQGGYRLTLPPSAGAGEQPEETEIFGVVTGHRSQPPIL